LKFDLLGPGYAGVSNSLDPSRRVNFYVELASEAAKARVSLVGTPGTILQYSLGNLPARGLHVFNGVLYAVAGNQLYSISASGTVTAIAGATLSTFVGPVVMKDNSVNVNNVGGNQLMIVDGSAGYVYNVNTGAFTNSTSFTGSGWPSTGAIALEYIDSYFLIGQTGSMNMYSSDGYNGLNWNTVAAASAQSAPDAIQALWNLGEQLFVVKQYTTEIFYNTGTAPALGFPFQRMTSAVLDVGTVAPLAVAKGASSLFILGNRRTGDGGNFVGAMRIQNDNPTIISPPAITAQMQNWSPWTDVLSYVYEQDGHTFWVVTSPSHDQTFCYDAAIPDIELAWHERSTYTAGSLYQVNRHVSNCYAFFNGMHLVGDYANGNIYQMTRTAWRDNGNPLVAFRTAQIVADKKKMLDSISLHQLVVDAVTGYGGNIVFSFSGDGGNTWSNEYSKPLGVSGQYNTRLSWYPLGLHQYSFIPRIAISDNCPRILLGGYIE